MRGGMCSTRGVTPTDLRDLLEAAAERAIAYATTVDERPVAPDEAALAGLAAFDEAPPTAGSDPAEVLRLLDAAGSPRPSPTPGPRTSARHR